MTKLVKYVMDFRYRRDDCEWHDRWMIVKKQMMIHGFPKDLRILKNNYYGFGMIVQTNRRSLSIQHALLHADFAWDHEGNMIKTRSGHIVAPPKLLDQINMEVWMQKKIIENAVINVLP